MLFSKMSKNTTFLALLAFFRALGPVRVWFATTPVTMMAVTCRSIYRWLADSGCCLGDRFQVSPRNHHVSLFTCLLLSPCNKSSFRQMSGPGIPLIIRIMKWRSTIILSRSQFAAILWSAQRNESNVSPSSCLRSQNSTRS